MSGNIITRRVLSGALVGALALGAGGCSANGPTDSTSSDAASKVSATDATTSAAPNVVGMTAQEAWETLTAAGYVPILNEGDPKGEAVVSSQADNPAGVGSVASIVDPNGVAHPELDDTDWKGNVDVWVDGMCPISNAVGFSETDAREWLESKGFEVVVVEDGQVDPNLNVVKSTVPPSGSWQPTDSKVTLTVTSEVTMPDVIGLDPVAASATLLANHLQPSPSITSSKISDDLPKVVSASAEAGATLHVGDEVTLEYDKPLDNLDE